MTITVREMTPADHDRVGELTVAGYEDSGTFVGDEYREQLGAAGARADDGLVLVAVDEDNRVLGSVVYTVPGDPAWEDRHPPQGDAGFRMLALAPDAQGRGVGSVLVDHCLDLARSQGRRRMVITTMATMTVAHHLYERRGFVRRPDLDVTFPSGVGLVLHLDLTDDAADHFPAPGPVPDEPPWYEDVWQDDPHQSSHC